MRQNAYSILLSSILLYIPQSFSIEEILLQLICIVLLFFQYVINRSCISGEKQPQLNVKLINLTFKDTHAVTRENTCLTETLMTNSKKHFQKGFFLFLIKLWISKRQHSCGPASLVVTLIHCTMNLLTSTKPIISLLLKMRQLFLQEKTPIYSFSSEDCQ